MIVQGYSYEPHVAKPLRIICVRYTHDRRTPRLISTSLNNEVTVYNVRKGKIEQVVRDGFKFSNDDDFTYTMNSYGHSSLKFLKFEKTDENYLFVGSKENEKVRMYKYHKNDRLFKFKTEFRLISPSTKNTSFVPEFIFFKESRNKKSIVSRFLGGVVGKENAKITYWKNFVDGNKISNDLQNYGNAKIIYETKKFQQDVSTRLIQLKTQPNYVVFGVYSDLVKLNVHSKNKKVIKDSESLWGHFAIQSITSFVKQGKEYIITTDIKGKIFQWTANGKLLKLTKYEKKKTISSSIHVPGTSTVLLSMKSCILSYDCKSFKVFQLDDKKCKLIRGSYTKFCCIINEEEDEETPPYHLVVARSNDKVATVFYYYEDEDDGPKIIVDKRRRIKGDLKIKENDSFSLSKCYCDSVICVLFPVDGVKRLIFKSFHRHINDCTGKVRVYNPRTAAFEESIYEGSQSISTNLIFSAGCIVFGIGKKIKICIMDNSSFKEHRIIDIDNDERPLRVKECNGGKDLIFQTERRFFIVYDFAKSKTSGKAKVDFIYEDPVKCRSPMNWKGFIILKSKPNYLVYGDFDSPVRIKIQKKTSDPLRFKEVVVKKQFLAMESIMGGGNRCEMIITTEYSYFIRFWSVEGELMKEIKHERVPKILTVSDNFAIFGGEFGTLYSYNGNEEFEIKEEFRLQKAHPISLCLISKEKKAVKFVCNEFVGSSGLSTKCNTLTCDVSVELGENSGISSFPKEDSEEEEAGEEKNEIEEKREVDIEKKEEKKEENLTIVECLKTQLNEKDSIIKNLLRKVDKVEKDLESKDEMLKTMEKKIKEMKENDGNQLVEFKSTQLQISKTKIKHVEEMEAKNKEIQLIKEQMRNLEKNKGNENKDGIQKMKMEDLEGFLERIKLNYLHPSFEKVNIVLEDFDYMDEDELSEIVARKSHRNRLLAEYRKSYKKDNGDDEIIVC